MARPEHGGTGLEDDPLWYKDAVIYELHVRTFFDADNDGMGDFRGLTEKLDYLRDLGVTALWLLPFYPSPWNDDGYDISDYTDVHPAYGTLSDFRRFLREAHRRGLRVINELVINHTSDQHPWFQRARHAKPSSRWRDYYVWSDTPEKYEDARIIFQDFESSNWAWDPEAEAYYWHRFYSQQPDLNFDNPQVHRAVMRAMDFWFRMGVDGMRLDAVPYLYEREGTNCENLPETHQFLKALRRHVDDAFDHRMLLAEANQWPEDAVEYFGDGDECHMAFHFPVMPRLFMAIRMEDRFPIIEIMKQTPPIPDTCQWATFLRNHDELTLEMVTDEERDYMYRVYAHDMEARINLGIRRRLAPLMGNDRRKIELMNGLLFSLPGTPVIYYGDEIGMGDNFFLGDRNGVRTPMQWSSDRNAGFSKANPQSLYLPVIIDPEYHYEAVNVEAQQQNSSSLLWWMRRTIALRKRYRALSRGTLEFLYPDNHKVLAFVRRYGDEIILALFNLSRFVQCVELDLAEFRGMVPVEVSGQTPFPPIGDLPYFLTLGPHAFYWFLLRPQRVLEEPVDLTAPAPPPRRLSVPDGWDQIFAPRHQDALAAALRRYLHGRRWFGGKARRIRSLRLRDAVPMPEPSSRPYIVLVDVAYVEGEPETYVLPLAFAEGETADWLERDMPGAVVAELDAGGREGLLYDALVDPAVSAVTLDLLARRRRLRGREGELRTWATRELRSVLQAAEAPLEPSALRTEQSNTSVMFGDRLILKLFRRTEAGVNPDLEIGRFLTRKGFPNTPAVVGSLEYRRGDRRGRRPAMTLAVLHRYVPNEGDAWEFTRDSLSRYFEAVLARPDRTAPAMDVSTATLLKVAEAGPPELAEELFGTYLESARILGRRTAELHRVLASEPDSPDFAPEPFSELYQRSLYQSMRNLASRVFRLLERQMGTVPEGLHGAAHTVLDAYEPILERFRSVTRRKFSAARIRTHGDYHLGQVLYTGKDFVIIDFEGEPARPVSTRRIKRSALRDVAGMIRSFHYAAYATVSDLASRGLVRPEATDVLDPWSRLWYAAAAGTFLGGYLNAAEAADFLPTNRQELETLLDVFLLEKAIYELSYELNNRPDWIRIPLRGILDLMAA